MKKVTHNKAVKVQFMNKKHIYVIISAVLNILIAIAGYYSILFGLLCIHGFLSKPSVSDRIIGILIYSGIYVITILLNFLLYKIFKKNSELDVKYFIIPLGIVIALGILYTVALLL